MNLKNLSILNGALLVLAMLTYFFSQPPKAKIQDERIGEAIASRSDLESVDNIAFSSGDAQVTLRKSGPADWHVAERFGFPVDFEFIRELIDQLVSGKIERLATANPEKQEQLGFSERKAIELKKGDELLLALEVGRHSDQSGRFFRYAGSDKVYLLDKGITFDTNPDAWCLKRLVDYTPSEATSIALQSQDGERFVLQRDVGRGVWVDLERPERELDREIVVALVTNFSQLNFEGTAPPDDEVVLAARSEALELELEFKDGAQVRHLVGRRPQNADPSEKLDPVDRPVYVFTEPSDATHPVYHYSSLLAFQISGILYDAIPETREEIYAKEEN